MEQAIIYAAVVDTLLFGRDATNSRSENFPWLMRGVPVTLKLRLFNGLDGTETYPVSNFANVTKWLFAVDSDFAAGTTPKIIGDTESIELATITETVGGVSRQMTELTVPITQMDSAELIAAIGDRTTLPGMVAEISGYNAIEELIWSRQIDGVNIRNRVAPLPENAYYKQFPNVTSAYRMGYVWGKGVPLYDVSLNKTFIGDGSTSGGVVIGEGGGGGSAWVPRVESLETWRSVESGGSALASSAMVKVESVSGTVTTLSNTVNNMGGTVTTISNTVNNVSSGNAALHSAAEWTSERIDDANANISDLQDWQEGVSANVDKIPTISAMASGASATAASAYNMASGGSATAASALEVANATSGALVTLDSSAIKAINVGTSAATVSGGTAELPEYLKLSGGTMTGTLTLPQGGYGNNPLTIGRVFSFFYDGTFTAQSVSVDGGFYTNGSYASYSSIAVGHNSAGGSETNGGQLGVGHYGTWVNCARFTGAGTANNNRLNIEVLDWSGNLTLAGDVTATVDGGTIKLSETVKKPITTVSGTSLTVSPGQVLEWHLTGNSTMSATGTAGKYGEAKVEIFTGSNTITFSGINLCDPLIPNAVNFCELHFIGTTVNLHVNNELYGEIVTVTSGTASGSLYYAINSTASEYVTFSGEHHQYTLDGGTIGRSVKMIGNGVDKTSIATPGGTLAVTSGSQVAFSNLDIAAVMSAGYATVNLANCHLEGMTGDGMKFSVENCELDGNNGPATFNVGGDGAGKALQDGCRIDNLLVKDVENTNAAVVNCYAGAGHNYENVTLRNCGCTWNRLFNLYTWSSAGTIKNIVIENCRSKQELAYILSPVPVDGLRITGGSASAGILANGTTQINDLRIESCTLSRGFFGMGTGTFTLVRPYLAATGESLWNSNHALVITDGTFATTSDNISNSGAVTFSGTNVMNGTVTNAAGGTVTLASGCTIDASGKTSGFIVSGAAGGLVVESGAAVIPNGGTASVALTGGTYTTLNNNGTLA